VLTRSLATTFCTLLPVLALLTFGGETLKDFAFALLIGIASGAYSSIFIASPVLTHWKEREPVYRSRRARIERETGGLVPAYATTATGAPEDIEPEQKKRRRRGRITEPEEPGQQISREEFQDLVADIQEDETSKGRAPVATKAPPEPEPEPEPQPESERDPAADLTPEDLVLKDKPKPRQKRPRNRRHGRSR
jgi:SecD/SecF fusion protein